jgi:MFS family permease
VLGAMAMQRAHRRWTLDVVASASIAILGVVTIVTGLLRDLSTLCMVMLIGGAGWISFISLFNVQVLNQAPDWVRARVLAISMLVFQGSIAAGSATWGALAMRFGISKTLMWAGIGAISTTLLGFVFHLSDSKVDLASWNHWRLPTVLDVKVETTGPVLVTVEYRVDRDFVSEFLETMHAYGRVRRRDGASRWGICRDLENSEIYLETFVVSSWAEHLRQHDRLTRADGEVENKLRKWILNEPKVRHLLYL